MIFHPFIEPIKLPIPFNRSRQGVYVFDEQEKQQFVDAAKQLSIAATSPEIMMEARSKTPSHYLFNNYVAPLDMMSVDLAITEDGPRLIELQSFSSIIATALTLECHYNTESVLDGRTASSRIHLLRNEINRRTSDGIAVILDLNAKKRPTACDFYLSEELFGVQIAELTDIRRRGDELFLLRGNGELQRIGFIWNRLIPTELSEIALVRYKNLFAGAEVQWMGHMDHFFSVSKASMPFLKTAHCVPCGFYLPGQHIPIKNSVLKPLFDFAGKGVNLSPSENDLLTVKTDMLWQERVTFSKQVRHGVELLRGEVRVMLVNIFGDWIPISMILRSSEHGFSSQTNTQEDVPGGFAAIV